MGAIQFLIIILLSPLLNGIIKKAKANMQGRQGPGVFQQYWDLLRLFRKDMVISRTASWIFHAAPFIVFASTAAAAMMLPVVTTESPLWFMGDTIAVIYLFALGRFFMALAGLDAGTAFGGEGSSREVLVGILVEPMIMLSIFTAAISAGSTNLSAIAESGNIMYTPYHLLALAALTVAVIAETGRVPVDNPDTHLELTMIHEGMLIEYSGRYLALMEWAHLIKQMVLFTLVMDIFFPIGIATQGSGASALALSAGLYFLKMAVAGVLAAFAESSMAKMRIFQLPSLLGGAFVLSLLSLLTFLMMGGSV